MLVAMTLAIPGVAAAQPRVSIGAGGGMAGSTDASLSDGRGAPIVMGQVTVSAVPLIGVGVEVDDWRRSGSNIVFATAHAQIHVPATPFYLKLGGGFGTGDPDGRGTISGAAGQIGAAYDITLPLAPVALTLFGNAFLAHASSRSMQLVDAGLALTWR
jgi:hypothetical protein